jgi:hypothetical protein
VRITGKLQNSHKAMMYSAWRKAVALDRGAYKSEDSFYFRHALVRGYASLASELSDWSSYEDAGMVIGWAVQLQQLQGGENLFANVSIKSVVAQAAVSARAMDLGLSFWKDIVGPLQTPGSGEDRELEIRGRCLLLHKLQFAAECVVINNSPMSPHTCPHSLSSVVYCRYDDSDAIWHGILPSLLLLAQRAPRAVEDEWSRDVMNARSSAFVNNTIDFLQFPASCVPSHDLVYVEALPLHVHVAFTQMETLLALKSLGGERMRAAVSQGLLNPWWAAVGVGVPSLLLAPSSNGVRVGVLSSDLKLSHPIGQLLLPIIDALHHSGGLTVSCLVIRRVW